MSKTRVKLNKKGVGAYLKSKSVTNCVRDNGREIFHKLPQGAGYSLDVKKMGTRYVTSVFTKTDEARKDNLDNNTILKALGSAKKR